MKLELKENMYIRTKDGIIDKVIIDYNGHCASPNCECKHISCDKNYYDEDKIVKASHNIIDLIERFDLVNGRLVICKMYENEKDIPTIVKCVGDYYFEEKDIKSIVTKEQFEQMAYKVED